MTETKIVLVEKRVSATAYVSHVATVEVSQPRKVAAVNVPAARGPMGPPGRSGDAPDMLDLTLLFENNLI